MYVNKAATKKKERKRKRKEEKKEKMNSHPSCSLPISLLPLMAELHKIPCVHCLQSWLLILSWTSSTPIKFSPLLHKIKDTGGLNVNPVVNCQASFYWPLNNIWHIVDQFFLLSTLQLLQFPVFSCFMCSSLLFSSAESSSCPAPLNVRALTLNFGSLLFL